MSIASWVYDHAPARVQTWMENREMQRMADKQYDAAHPGCRRGRIRVG